MILEMCDTLGYVFLLFLFWMFGYFELGVIKIIFSLQKKIIFLAIIIYLKNICLNVLTRIKTTKRKR